MKAGCFPPPKRYYHSGAIGDIIYGLCAIKLDGGGSLIVGPELQKPSVPTTPITLAQYHLLKPLLEAQSYIADTSYDADYQGPLHCDLNIFRNFWWDSKTKEAAKIGLLAQMQCYVLGLHERFDHVSPWLSVPRPIATKKYIISRSPRYQNPKFDWPRLVEILGAKNLLFTGLDDEHAAFCNLVNCPIEMAKVKNFLGLASLIAGSLGFAGNQSAPCAVAIALGQRVIQEALPISPDCLFHRSNLLAYTSGGFICPDAVEKWKRSKLGPLSEPISLAGAEHTPVISMVVFNRLDLTRRCLEMLFAHTPAFRLVITDNASTDGTADFLQAFAREHSNVTIFTNSQNLGFQEPNNRIFESLQSLHPTPEYIVLLNNDLEIGPGWWQRAEQAFSADPRLAIVGSSVGACGHLSPDFHGHPVPAGGTPDYAEGSLLAIRASLVAKLGLFDKNLTFMYGEDSDLSLRVREAGYHIAAVDLNCRHLVNQTLRIASPQLLSKIRASQEANHNYLRRRWFVYLRRKSFDYRVLLNRRAALGDVIDVTVAASELKRRWPSSQISVQTACPDVFVNNPNVRQAGPVMQGEFDYVFNLDLSYESRPDLHTITAYGKACGLDLDLAKARPQIYPSAADEKRASSLINSQKNLVAIHAAQSWPGKTWPRERWVELIAVLQNLGYTPVLTGGERLWDLGSPGMDLRGLTSVQLLYSILKRCRLFVGIDSAPSHVAQAADCPAAVLFGTVWSHLKLFPSAPSIGVQADIEEAPCVGEHHRLVPPVTSSSCDGACMRAISVEMVIRAIQSIS